MNPLSRRDAMKVAATGLTAVAAGAGISAEQPKISSDRGVGNPFLVV